EDLKSYQLNLLETSKLVFKVSPSDVSCAVLTEILASNSQSNSIALQFEQWYNSTSLRLQQLAIRDPAIAVKREYLAQQISSFYVKFITEVIEARGTFIKNANEHTIPKSVGRVIEREVSLSVSSYKFPSPLAFRCSWGAHLNRESRCKALLKGVDSSLDPNQSHSQDTMRQLRWIELTLIDLRSASLDS
ncbi:912_t:CDS:1, partial [Acaulospora colombiana]